LQIGFLISGSLDTLTGGYIYDRQLVDYLCRKGHQVKIFNLPCSNYWERFLYSPQLLFSQPLNHSPLDILLEDELDHPALILLNRKLKRESNYPVISIVHNLHSCELRADWQNYLYRRIEKSYLLSVDGFIFNSHTTRQAIEQMIGIQRYSVTANPCGNRLPVQITAKEIEDRAKKPGPLQILFLGNLLPNKGLHVLLNALSGISGNNYFLTIVGDLTMDKAYSAAIGRQIRKLNLVDKVSITWPLNNADLAIRLKESHILAVPSFYEGYGIVYLEGMGFGLPAIATTSGAAREIITDGENGFLISPGDSTTLAHCLQELNQERSRLAAMSLNAHRRFKSHPGWQVTCEKIHNFLLSCRSTLSA
jgi:glycosyltransferase involved in cell wall biosynthesis